jgi:glycine cleavage system aminomethyltransferase T
MGVYGTTGRLEKAYRLFGAELDLDYTVVEADMAPAKVKDQDFIGKAAVVAAMAEAPVARLCTLTVDDHTSASGEKRYMLGRQPIVMPDGSPITDAKGRRSYATSAGAGPSLGKHILLAYLPSDLAVEGSRLAVEYFQELYPVTVSVVGARPPFDPENLRIRA